MDNTSVTTNTDNTSCFGSLMLSSDNFSTCIKMSSSPSSSNSDKTFTIDPYDNISNSTSYKTRVTTGVKDTTGNTLSRQYETSTGFTTAAAPWAGTKQLGSSNNDYAYGVATDSPLNFYAAGYTSGGLDGNTSAGSYDLFVVK